MATLTATVGAGNMRFEDLATSLGNVAPAASAAGVTLPELGAAMATLTDRGFSADEAATRLRMTLSLIQAPTAKARKALKDMGVDAESLGGMLRQPNGLLKVLETLNDAVQRVGQTRGNRDLLAGFGGGRSGLGIQTLVQSLNQSLSSYQSKLVDVSAGEKKYAANQQSYLGSESYKLHTALSTLESDLTKLGRSIAPEVTTGIKDIAAVVDTLAKGFEALPGPVKTDLGVIVAAFAVAGPLALGVIGVTKLIGTMRKAIALLPLSAGPAAVETGTEIATGVGAGVATAGAEVSALRLSLLGLGALAIAPIVIPIEYDFAKSKYNPLGGPLSKLGATLAGPSAAGSSGPGHGGFAAAISAAQQLMIQYGSDFQHAGPAERAAAGKLMQQFPSIAPDQWASIWNIAATAPNATSGGSAKHAALVANAASHQAAAASAGTPTTPTTTAYTPSKVAELNLALAKNPNDKAAINAKLAYDREAAAFAEKRIKDGKGSPALIAQLEQVYQDEGQLQEHLTALHNAAAAATKKHDAAVKKHRAEVAKAAATLTVPLGLQLAEAKAGASGVESQQVKAAKAIKAWAKTILASTKTTTQQQIDAFNLIAQENQTIGSSTHGAGMAVKASAESLVAGVAGLSRAQKVALEQRYSQVQAHGGYRPTGHGVAGQTITVNVHGDPNPERTAEKVIAKLQQQARHGTAQRRGPHAGSYLGVH
jgi:hypothetical protein